MVMNLIQDQERTKKTNKGPKPVPLKFNTFFPNAHLFKTHGFHSHWAVNLAM